MRKAHEADGEVATGGVSMGDDRWREWIGRSETVTERLGAVAPTALAATLDLDWPALREGDVVPPLWHWVYFAPIARHSELGPDGHPRRGGFLPPVELPRRMWAGGRLRFDRPLRIGETVARRSRILGIESKRGRSGELVFVCVEHVLHGPDGPALTEQHDIVYREAPAAGAPAPKPRAAPAVAGFEREIRPDPVLLFRYSALTFNGHRIHYDRSYATGVEGYPGLVVHGPLIASLLVDLLRRQRPDAVLRRFDFQAVRPLFDVHPFRVCGAEQGRGRFELWALDHEGHLAMRAEAEIDPGAG